MKTPPIIFSLLLLLSVPLVSPTAISAETAGDNILIKDWETEPLIGVIEYEGRDRSGMTRPTWVIQKSDRPSSDAAPADPKIQAPNVYDLVHLGPKGEFQRRVRLGEGLDILVSEDGHRFLLSKYFCPEGKGRDLPRKKILEVVDNAGNVKQRSEGLSVYPYYLAPGGNYLVAHGYDRAFLEVYDSQFKKIEACGEPQGGEGIKVFANFSAKNGVFALIILDDQKHLMLYTIGPSGKLMFDPVLVRDYRGTNWRSYDLHVSVVPEHKVIMIQAEKMVEGKNVPERYITVVDFSGRTVIPEVILPVSSGDYDIQVSRNAEYFRVHNRHRMNLVSRDGALVYTLPISGFDESNSGYLSDDGRFIGFLGKWQNMVVVNQEGDVVELEVPKPKRVKAFDLNTGLILSEEFPGPGDRRLVGYRIPGKLDFLITDMKNTDGSQAWLKIKDGDPGHLIKRLNDDISVVADVYKIGVLEVLNPIEIWFQLGGGAKEKSFLPPRGSPTTPRPVTVYASPNKMYYAFFTALSSAEGGEHTYHFSLFDHNGNLIWENVGPGQEGLKSLDKTDVIVMNDGSIYFIDPHSNNWKRILWNGKLSFSNKLIDEKYVYDYAIVSSETGRYVCISMPYNLLDQPYHTEFVLLDLAVGTKVMQRSYSLQLGQVMLVHETPHLIIAKMGGKSLVVFDFSGKLVWSKEFKDWVRSVSVNKAGELKVTYDSGWESLNATTAETLDTGTLE